MAKKDKQAKKDKSGGTAADSIDAIRSAIERTLEGAGLTEKRQREVVEQVSAATGRIRKTLDDLKVVDEVREMRTQLETLAARVAELESGARSRVTGAARAAAGSRSTSTRSTGTRSTGTRSTASRSTAGSSRATTAKSSGTSRAKPKTASTRSASSSSSGSTRSTAGSSRAKPKSTTAKKPSTSRSRSSSTRSKPSS